MDKVFHRVIIESPYAGNINLNTAYARLCLRDSIDRNEAPIASHLLYPQVLDELDPKDREQGIALGLAWLSFAQTHVFYVDLGMSPGMLAARDYALKQGIGQVLIEYRNIFSHYTELRNFIEAHE